MKNPTQASGAPGTPPDRDATREFASDAMVCFHRLIVISLSLAGLAFGQRVTYEALAPSIIEERLRSAPKKQAEREPMLESLFRDAGCEFTTQQVKGQKSPNVVCRLPGKGPGEIVVGAHFDLLNSAGVVDNWSGAALLPSLFQSLKSKELNHTFVFVGFTAEEQGLLGSKAYVKQNSLENVRAMINLDTLGLSDTKIWASHSDPALLQHMISIAKAAKMPVAGVNVEQVGDSDSESFRDKKIPAMTIHSLTQETLKILHNPKDRFEAVDMDAYQRSYRLIALFLAYLDLKLDPPPASKEPRP